MKKIKQWIQQNKKVLMMCTMMALMCVSMVVVASAEGTAVVSSTDIQPILTALQGQVSVSSIIGVLGIVVGAAVGLVFMWWGVRKVVSVIMRAFKKGKLSL